VVDRQKLGNGDAVEATAHLRDLRVLKLTGERGWVEDLKLSSKVLGVPGAWAKLEVSLLLRGWGVSELLASKQLLPVLP